MSRKELQSADQTKCIAFGVDGRYEPGVAHTFVQVWSIDSEDGDIGPCNEGEGGYNNMLADERDVTLERVVELGKEHGIDVDPVEVFKLFD